MAVSSHIPFVIGQSNIPPRYLNNGDNNSYDIFIRDMSTGRTLSIQCNPGFTVRDLRSSVSRKLGINPGETRFIFGSKELSDDGQYVRN